MAGISTESAHVASMLRPAVAVAGGYLARGAGVQLGPPLVNHFVNATVNGTFCRFAVKQVLHAAIGPYYALAGQLLFTAGLMFAPGPETIASKAREGYRTLNDYRINRSHQEALRQVDAGRLDAEEEDDWVVCSQKPVEETYVILDDNVAEPQSATQPEFQESIEMAIRSSNHPLSPDADDQVMETSV